MSDGFSKEEIQAEIREAVRILREDGILGSLKGISEKLAKAFPDGNDNNDGNPDGGSGSTPPPKTEPKASSDDTGKRKSKWWGDQL